MALKAANLYSEGNTFGKISEELEVSKSRVGDLIREGIFSMANHDGNPDDPPIVQVRGEQENNPFPQTIPINLPLDSRTGSYMLETQGIGRRILLTPKAIMIYDLWRGSGFTGDLSDFIEDTINFMYETRRPHERPNY